MNVMGIKHPAADCEHCPLQSKPMAPSQNVGSKVAFVARSPGFYEAQAGKPFSGPSGDVLNHLLKINGVNRDDILLTNVVLCAPDAGKVPPEAIKACAPRLRQELQHCDLILAGGSEAVAAVIGRGSIDSYRGYRIDRGGKTLVATNNPALVLRDDSKFPNLVKDFKRAFNPTTQPPFPTVEVIEDGSEARKFTQLLLDNGGPVAVDLETRGGLGRGSTIVSCQFSVEGSFATVIGERDGIFEDGDFLVNSLKPLVESTACRFIFWNGKYDTKVFNSTYGIAARVDEDAMLLHYSLDERGEIHSLEYNLAEEFGWPDYEPDSVKRFKKSGVVEDYDELYEYAGWDVAGTFQLWQHFNETAPALDKTPQGVRQVYNKLLIPASNTFRVLELNGMKYDVEAASNMMELEVGPELVGIQDLLRDKLKKSIFNPRSPVQVSSLYYDEWRITHAMQFRPDKGRSVDDAARKEILAGRFTIPEEDRARYDNSVQEQAQQKRTSIMEIVRQLDRAAELQKQASTYLVGLIKDAAKSPESRIHTSLNLHTTVTGRPSSVEPNLLNITRTKEGLPDIRKLFVADPGWKIVQADYSQAELRCIAQFSNDPTLKKVYTDGEDLHNLTAARFFGSDYTKEQRSISKSCNFGVFYRQSADTFQEKHGIAKETAQSYIDWTYKEFPAVWAWEKEVEKEVHANVVTSPFGRRRRFYLITRENKAACYREAINFYPQSTSADFTLLSLIILENELDPLIYKLCLTVYDSIIAEVEEDYIDNYKKICQEVMESRPKEELGWQLPFKVDIGVGDSWGSLDD